MSFLAKYRGHCELCGGSFNPGDLITRTEANGERWYEHKSCPDDPLLPDVIPEACTDCFMVKPCMCTFYD